MLLPHRSGRLRAVFDGIAIGLFTAALAAPHWDELARPASDRGPERFEYRASAPWPGRPQNLPDLATWPARCEDWISDGMGYREWILGRNSALKLFVFGVAPSDTVVLGRDGFLFYSGNHTLEIQRGVRPFAAAQLDAWVAFLEKRRAWCAERGIRHLFVVAPNKESIYAEHLPDWCAPLGPTRHDQLVERLRERSSPFELLDLRPALHAARAGDLPRHHLYSKLGTHWDGRGIWVAYDAILRRLAPQFPALVPLPFEQLHLVTMNANPDSWALRMYVGELFDPHLTPAEFPHDRRRREILAVETGPNTYARSTVADPTLPRAVFMHDSFGTGIDALLAEHFAEFQTSHNPIFEPEFVAAAQPDVVIELFVERIFDYWTPPPAPGAAGATSVSGSSSGSPGAPADLTFATTPGDTPGARWSLPVPEAGVAVEARGNLRMLPAYDEPVGLELVVGSTLDTLVLPRVAPVAGARSRMHVRMTAPVESEFDLWFRRAGGADYRRKDVRTVSVRPGTNDFSIALEDAWLAEPLMIRPGRHPGRYRILALEIHPAP